MICNRYIKAFTILETLISLMLMSIIFTVSYALFNLVGKQLYMFQRENSQVLEYNLFNAALLSDIENANDFELSGDHLLLKNYDASQVEYKISTQSILRKRQSTIDTFKLKLLNYKFSSFGEHSSNKVVSISINVLKDTINTNYFLKKNLSKIVNQTYFNEN